ncbi:MAG: nucleotidyltransferase family protein [Acidobacteria bacterium]|nr:nucleotidyltransferase family protein [Acidobacteriota bacterium]
MSKAIHPGLAPAGNGFLPPRAGLLGLLATPVPQDADLRAALEALPEAEVPALLERTAYHRIDGLAHRALRRIPSSEGGRWLRMSLRRRHQRCAAAALSQGLALAEVLEALDRSRVPVIVLRGLRTSEALYGDPGLRPFEDHDLLVLPADFEAARGALGRQGYAEEAPGLHRRGGVIVDLHRDPLGARRRPTRAATFPLPTAELFARAAPGTVAGAPALLLGLEDDLLLLAVHLVKHSFDRLIRIADLAHLLAQHGEQIRWAALLRRAAASRTLPLLAWAVEAAGVLGAPWPAALPRPPAGLLEKEILRRVADLRPLPYCGEALMALAAPTLSSRVGFLMDALLPAGGAPAGGWRRAAAIPRRALALARGALWQAAERRGLE